MYLHFPRNSNYSLVESHEKIEMFPEYYTSVSDVCIRLIYHNIIIVVTILVTTMHVVLKTILGFSSNSEVNWYK